MSSLPSTVRTSRNAGSCSSLDSCRLGVYNISVLVSNLDFEVAPVKVLRQIFPGLIICFCLFHLGQSLHRWVQKNGLEAIYRDIEAYRSLLRSFLALAFLNPDDVPDAFDELSAALLTRAQIDGVEDSMNGSLFSMFITLLVRIHALL